MERTVSLDRLARGIRTCASPDQDFTATLELYLERELAGIPVTKRIALVEELAERFSGQPSAGQGLNLGHDETGRILALLSGVTMDLASHSPQEISEKFTTSLNILFDTLNQIIAVIHTNLLGEKPELETIRHVIGGEIGGDGRQASLKEHLDKIRQSFMISHGAFQDAARSVVGDMMAALDPEAQDPQGKSKSILSFGPMRKAEQFDVYQDKYRECRRWFDGGRFSERLLREFEKNCQKKLKGNE